MAGLVIIAPLAFVVILGMALRGFGFFTNTDRGRLTKLLYWVVLPGLLFRTTYLAGDSILQHRNLFLATYASFLVTPIFAILVSAFITHRGQRNMHALSAMAAARANNLYLGLPTVVLALGDIGIESSAVYLAIALPGFNLVSILWGEVVKGGRLSFGTLLAIVRRLLRNPLLCSSLLGLTFAQLKIPVPEMLLTSMRLVGDMATGIALIALGMGLDMRSIPGAIRRTWPDVLIKLFLHPAVCYALFLIWPVSELYLQTAVIIAAMPTAVNTFIMAGGMGLDENYASELVAMTTAFAPFSIPIWISLVGV